MEPDSAAPQHYAAPTTREKRAHSVQRLQIGLFGLATMFLLVALANIIMDRAHLIESGSKAAVSKKADDSAGDPFVDIGVAPAPQTPTPTPSP